MSGITDTGGYIPKKQRIANDAAVLAKQRRDYPKTHGGHPHRGAEYNAKKKGILAKSKSGFKSALADREEDTFLRDHPRK